MTYLSLQAAAPFRTKARWFLRAGAVALACASTSAFAQCTADATGTNVTCSGTVTGGYQNPATGVTLTAVTGAAITGPVLLGSSATVSNAGTISATAGSAAVQAGDLSNVVNNGTITSVSAAAGSAGIVLGDHAAVTNAGSLSAIAGTDAVQFGRGGTFQNLSTATAVATGNIQFGLNLGTDLATFSNANTAFGFTGSVISSGNTRIDNAGLFNGAISQIATLGSVSIVNEAAGTYTGTITTGDVTTLTNNGTMVLSGLSQIGTLLSPGTSFTNNAALTIGTTTSATTLIVNGAFAQSASGTTNIAILAPTAGVPVAGATYGQIYAAGTTGTAALAGTLTVTPSAGFYPTGATYNVVVADHGVTGTFGTVTGNALTFITFVPTGVATLANGQQAYQLTVQRNGTYASVIAPTATAQQVAIATAFQPLVATATASPTTSTATLIGQVDFLSIAAAETFFADLSPAGYTAYAHAMRDQTNMFQRQIGLRMHDDYSTQPGSSDETVFPGFWLQGFDQFAAKSTANTGSRETSLAFAGGYDVIGEHFTLGGAVGYASDKLRYNGGNLVGHTNGTQFALYGSYHVGMFFADAIGSYQFGHLNATRTMLVGTVTDTAAATPTDHLLSGTGKIGANIKLNRFVLSPFAGVQVDQGSIRQFTEVSTTATYLTVGRIDARRTDLLLGAALNATSGSLRPYIRGTYRSRLGSDPSANVTAYLDGDTTTSFTVAGQPQSAHEADVDAGVQWIVDDGAGLYLGYQGSYRGDLTAHGVMFGFRGQF